MRLFCAVAATLFAEGLLSRTSDSIVNLANGGFVYDICYHIIGVCLSSFAHRPATASVAAVLFCADYYAVKFASSSCVRFICFGFLLATTCVWVWMVCSLHSVTTGSRDRANVSLIIIITTVPSPTLFEFPLCCLPSMYINKDEPHLYTNSVCVCVFSSHPFWTSSSLDVPAGVTQEEGHTGFFIHLPSAVRALIFVARRIQPFLSLVDREVEFCVLTN